MIRGWRAAMVMVGGALLGCQAGDPAPPSVSTAGSATTAAPPFDVTAAVRRVHFAFRAEEAVFTGGHTTYGAEVDANGAVRFTPVRRTIDRRVHTRSDRSESRQVREPEAQHRGHRRAPRAGVERGTTATLTTVAIERGGQSLLSTGGAATSRDDGSLTIDRGGAIEELRNTEAGLEQSWRFAARPAGDGALVVRVHLDGMTLVAQSGAGLRFSDGMSGLRYGAATWVDARGIRTALRARYVDGKIVIEAPAEVVDGSSYPAVLDPTVSPEFTLDDQPVPSPPGGLQAQPIVAFDGANYLAVWFDQRAYTADYRATRITPAGVVLDPVGFLVDFEGYVRSLACDGTSCLAVGERSLDGAICGLRIARSGQVIDSGGFVISAPVEPAYADAVAFDGANYLVVWEERRGATSFDVLARRVSTIGLLLDAAPIAIATTNDDARRAAVAFDGTDYLVAWQRTPAGSGSGGEIHVTRVATSGTVRDPAGIKLPAVDAWYPVVTCSPTNCLVTWSDRRSGLVQEPYGARVAGGQVLDPGGIALTTQLRAYGSPSVAFGAGSYFATWELDGAPYARRLAPDGQLLDAAPVQLASAAQISSGGYSMVPSISFDGSNFLVAWHDERSTSSDPYFLRLDAAGRPIEAAPVPLVTGTSNTQTIWSAGFDGTNYFVVWQDFRGGDAYLYGARLGPTGTMLDPNGILIERDNYAPGNAAVVGNANGFFVAWNGHWYQDQDTVFHQEIWGRRIAGDGTPAFPSKVVTSLDANSYGDPPAIATNGTVYLVVWSDSRDSDSDRNISENLYGSRIDLNGSRLDSRDIAISKRGYTYTPTVGYNGTNYYVAWEDYKNETRDIYGTRVRPSNGFVFTSLGTPISRADGDQYLPRVASDGTGFLVVWEDGRSGNIMEIYGARIAPIGSVTDPDGIPIATGSDATTPTVAFGGTNYLVAWTDLRTAASAPDIYGARVTSAGQLLDASGFAIANEATDESGPVAVAGPAGEQLVAYTKYDRLTPFATLRARARVLSDRATGSACSAGWQCPSGFCVDGVCCDAACGGDDNRDCRACSVAKGATRDGLCSTISNGTGCSDGNACTSGDRCAAGACQPQGMVVCAAIDPCHLAGQCNTQTGQCSNPINPACLMDGGALNDGAVSSNDGGMSSSDGMSPPSDAASSDAPWSAVDGAPLSRDGLTSGDAATDGDPTAPSEAAGCGCRIATAPVPHGPLLLILLFALLSRKSNVANFATRPD